MQWGGRVRNQLDPIVLFVFISLHCQKHEYKWKHQRSFDHKATIMKSLKIDPRIQDIDRKKTKMDPGVAKNVSEQLLTISKSKASILVH